MTYDLYAIKPEHDQKYGVNILNFPQLFEDDWYKSSIQQPYSLTIWKSWRSNYFDEPYNIENCIPKDLQGFYFDIYDKQSAENTSKKLSIYDKYIDIKDFIQWLNYWSEKDAKFYLSR